MEFLAIMFVGTLVAVWAVAGSRPTRRSGISYLPPLIPPEMNPHRPPEIWQYRPMDKIEYAEAVERHESDPVHNPFPLPLPDQKHNAFLD
jgi:hypothetical protein